MNITIEQVRQLWPHWPRAEFLRFEAAVLRDVTKSFRKQGNLSRVEFLLMGIDRWLASICPMFSESARFFICNALRNDKQLVQHAGQLDGLDEVKGFHLSIFDDRWVSWDGSTHLLDVRTFEWLGALPRPHIWVTILGVTPLYFQLLTDLEELVNAATANPDDQPKA